MTVNANVTKMNLSNKWTVKEEVEKLMNKIAVNMNLSIKERYNNLYKDSEDITNISSMINPMNSLDYEPVIIVHTDNCDYEDRFAMITIFASYDTRLIARYEYGYKGNRIEEWFSFTGPSEMRKTLNH